MKALVVTSRAIHGVVVILDTFDFGQSLLGCLRSLPLILEHHVSYLLMCSGLVAVSIFILWNALSKSGRRSLGSALVSYGVWLALLVWNGWFWDWAAYRNHSDSEAGDILFEQDRMAMCIGIAIRVAIYALFPILCYFDRRTERVKALH